MSREIRFRAWYKPEERMIYDVQNEFEERIELGMNCFGDYLKNDDFVVEQDTGLKDKNGETIWEGDIVRWVDDYDENAYISFDEGCFWVNWPINSERINGEMADDLEVLGNIHENPELLEEK